MASTQADMTRGSPKTEGEDRLSALPAELLVSVVERLPVRQICRFRSLSRQLRNFVDTNQGSLTQDLVSYHRARIETEYKLLTDLSDCDIIDALRRYDSHYGLVTKHWTSESSLPKLVALMPTLYFNWAKSQHRSTVVDELCEFCIWIIIYSTMSIPKLSFEHTDRLSRWAARKCQEHTWSHSVTDPKAFMTKFAQVTSTRVATAYPAVPANFVAQRKVSEKYDSPFLKTRKKEPEPLGDLRSRGAAISA